MSDERVLKDMPVIGRIDLHEIERRDPDGARKRMEEHLDCGSQLMKEALLRGHLAGVGI